MKTFLKQNWFEITIATCGFMVAFSVAFYFVSMALYRQGTTPQKVEVQRQGGEINEWHRSASSTTPQYNIISI